MLQYTIKCSLCCCGTIICSLLLGIAEKHIPQDGDSDGRDGCGWQDDDDDGRGRVQIEMSILF